MTKSDDDSASTDPSTAQPATPADIAGATIGAGMWALGILSERLQKRLAAHERDPDNEPAVSDADLWRLAEAGQKMAGVAARSKVPISAPDLSGFRAGAGGLPSPRMGHVRVRSVGGRRRPVVDEGRADREEYNRKARERGDEQL